MVRGLSVSRFWVKCRSRARGGWVIIGVSTLFTQNKSTLDFGEGQGDGAIMKAWHQSLEVVRVDAPRMQSIRDS